MRLFIAVNFEDGVKDGIQDVIREVKKSSIKGKFVKSEHIHLTLEFLGEIPPEKIGIITDVMDELVSKPFKIKLSELGYFRRKDGNIYWLGIEHNDILLRIQSNIHKLLLKQGFQLEDRTYKPHITIGRKVKMEDRFNSKDLSHRIEQIHINVDKIDIMKSEHNNGKLIHSTIYTKSL